MTFDCTWFGLKLHTLTAIRLQHLNRGDLLALNAVGVTATRKIGIPGNVEVATLKTVRALGIHKKVIVGIGCVGGVLCYSITLRAALVIT